MIRQLISWKYPRPMLQKLKKTSVLMELRPAFDGFAGIPQETRLVFSALSSTPEVDLTGLLIHGARQLSPGLRRGHQYSEAARINRLSRHVSCYGDGENIGLGRLQRLCSFTQRLALHGKLGLTAISKRPVALTDFQPEHFRDFLWSTLFSKTLPSGDMEQVLTAKYAILSPPYDALHRLGMRPFLRPPYVTLDTEGYDFLLAQTPFPAQISRQTLLVVRYHDAIPLFLPHTVVRPKNHQRSHYSALLDNQRHAFFACTSEATRGDLLKVFPQLERRSTVIHDIVSHEYFVQEAPRARLAEIIVHRLDAKTHSKAKLSVQSLAHKLAYVMMVSTIEPRKNHLALIAAWEQLRSQSESEIKLVLVGSLGWADRSITARMQAWQERGELFHLSGVPAHELRLLYHGAEAVVCPSVCEGFDYAGVEAMLCGTAVVASRIPAHTEIYGDCAEYFDPYSAADISAAISRIVFPSENHRRRSMIERGLIHSRRYTRSEIIPRWRELFAEKAALQSRVTV